MAKINKYRLLRRLPLSEGWKLRCRRWMLEGDFEKATRGLRDDPEWDGGDWSMDFADLEDSEQAYHSRKLQKRASQLRLPIPPLFQAGKVSGDWVRSGRDGRRFYLSIEGEQKLRHAIREEEKHRSETWTRRLPYVTAITGLVGTITGLVAVIMKGHS